jgi:CheY-like chemotaxis protein
VLKRPDYDTVLAGDGHDALKIAETSDPFDLLLTDLDIPGIEGPELARRFRALDPAIKILYLAREADRLFEERTALWEEEAFLEAPLTAQGVLEAVSLMLVGHIPPLRPTRVHVPGSVMRFENQAADVVRFSVTGALTRASEPLETGSVRQVTFELPSETLQLDARVVSCEQVAPGPRDAALPPRPFAIALAFVTPSARSLRALQRIVQEALQTKQAAPAPARGPIKR